jgi:tRNA G18 (ribose-2'-O)-methylase SpoU
VPDNVQLTHGDHQQSKLPNSKFPLSLIANDINSPLNVGSLFRLCDALGIEKLYLCGDTPIPPNAKINKTSRSSEKYVTYESHTSAESLVTSLKQSGITIVSLEISSSSIDIRSAEFRTLLKQDKPICLILGSENSGVSEMLLSLSDVTTHIPMMGNNSSMNVVSAASIACFEITKNLV